MTPRSTDDIIMLGDSVPMQVLRREIELVARSDLPVLISGETGVGKELTALALHRSSGRSGAFVPVNGCATSETMFESAMFGHEPGAFTGAVSRRPGYIAEADLGTLLLDEVCSLPLESQAKLLRAIDTNQYRRLGASRDSTSRFRLVSASNRSLQGEVDAGRFRLDLLHRLCGIELVVPPLRERGEDVLALFRHYLELFDPTGDSARELDREAAAYLRSHEWPGNVRELRHVAQRAVLRARGARTVVRDHLVPDGRATRGRLPASDLELRSKEAQLLGELLRRYDWCTKSVARELLVSRKTVYERMRRLGLQPARRGRSGVASARGRRLS